MESHRSLTLQGAVHALVEAPVLHDRCMHDVKVLENVPAGLDSALQCRGVADVEFKVLLLDLGRGAVRLGDTGGRKWHIDPARETVLDVPLALAVAYKYEGVDLLNK